MRWTMSLMLLAQGAVTAEAVADSVWMNDGSVRTGLVVGKTDDEVLLRVDREGIKATIGLPTKNVVRVEKSAEPQTLRAAANATPLPAVPAESKISRPTVYTTELPAARGFFLELIASATGEGADMPQRLPDDLRELWNDALRKESQNKLEELLEALRALDDAFMPMAGGMERLEVICRHQRKESFGVWMARVHWDVVAGKHIGGRFELGDVREVERKPLIGILKEKTAPALEPLKGYFPPVDPKTGKKEPFKPSQLQGITVGNALEVKKQASYASAVLLAQLKLEPEMPAIDKLYIGNQLTTVRRILARAMEFEPAAKAAAEKATTQRR